MIMLLHLTDRTAFMLDFTLTQNNEQGMVFNKSLWSPLPPTTLKLLKLLGAAMKSDNIKRTSRDTSSSLVECSLFMR